MEAIIPPTDFPYDRPSPVAEILGNHNELATAWEKSSVDLLQLKERCETTFSSDLVSSMSIAGSLGRMESLLATDIDCIIVVGDQVAESDQQKVVETFDQLIVELGYTPPKPGGVFSTASTCRDIVAANEVGKLDEPVGTFSKRMHLLLETQPIFGFKNHAQLIDQILQRWGQSSTPGAPWWLYLQNDIVRYWRALQIDYQWRHIESPARFRLRNLKLYHSRLTAIAGLHFVLGASTLQNDPHEWIPAMLRLTPWERVVRLVQRNEESSAVDFLRAYSNGHIQLNDADFRDHASQSDMELKAASLRRSCDSLTEILASVISSRPTWASKEFWNRLIVG